MVSSSTVTGDADTFASIMSNYDSSIGDVSSSWQGTSADSLQQKANEFYSEYEGVINSQMTAFAQAVELYENYKIEKQSVESAQQQYAEASNANDSAKMSECQSNINTHKQAQENLKSQIESALETVKGSKLSAVSYAFNNEFVNYYQFNYADYTYGGGTIKTWGCGPTSLAMVMTYLLGEEITPIETAAKGEAGGYAIGGTTWDYFPAMADEYGVNCEQLPITSENIINTLQEGKPIIINMGVGAFTSYGHYIVLRGVDENGQIIVADPASEERTETRWDVDIFIEQGKGMWAYSV